jgi:hypothetical protein
MLPHQASSPLTQHPTHSELIHVRAVIPKRAWARGSAVAHAFASERIVAFFVFL